MYYFTALLLVDNLNQRYLCNRLFKSFYGCSFEPAESRIWKKAAEESSERFGHLQKGHAAAIKQFLPP
jgi:hypothetical protein